MSKIIAEIGQNHCGNMQIAEILIGVAKLFGADLVKFQLYNTSALYKPDSPFINLAREAELSFDNAKHLFDYGERLGMEVFFSVFDLEKAGWCEDIGVKRYKIACSHNTNKPLLDAVESTGKPVIISSNGKLFSGKETLYCVPEYPANEVDFTHLEDFAGFSDHTIGIEAAKVAIDLGVKIIEKHFAIDHKTGVDAPWSMNPRELKEIVKYARSHNTG